MDGSNFEPERHDEAQPEALSEGPSLSGQLFGSLGGDPSSPLDTEIPAPRSPVLAPTPVAVLSLIPVPSSQLLPYESPSHVAPVREFAFLFYPT